MRSPVNKSYILDILRLKPRAKRNVRVLGVAVGFFYKPWVIFSQRKSFKKIIFFSHFLGSSKFEKLEKWDFNQNPIVNYNGILVEITLKSHFFEFFKLR